MLGDDPAQVREAQPIPDHPTQLLQYQDWFQDWFPKCCAKPPSDTFEIALVLAGAVSAGAYTAGVMDSLFEALDEWCKHRRKNEDLPNHNVVLRVIAGASAGGINGAIAAAACRYEFPPVNFKNANASCSQNPFYNTWVEKIDIGILLDTSDICAKGKGSKPPVRSLLNSEALDKLALDIVDKKWGKPKSRCWLADPFKLLLTVTNLRGVPYSVRFSGPTGLGHEMVMHRDHIGFWVPASSNPTPIPNPPPDVLPLTPGNKATYSEWRSLAVAALASGAFPVALAARCLSRPGSDYDYRFVYPHARPQQPSSTNQVVFSKPKIDRSNPYTFTAVDGGAMNNEPFELARVELAGMKGRNPREGHEACRAVIMIDPFTDPREDAKPRGTLLATFSALLKALISQSRFKQIDLTLAEAGDVYSRFMIAPSREKRKGKGKVTGSKALASSGLDGFLGFFSRDYRHHDYMLGRRNCQRFLRDWFVLPSSQIKEGQQSTGSALFANWKQSALDNKWFMSRSRFRQRHRQIIPLVGKAKKKQPLVRWPACKFGGYNQFGQEIEARIDDLYPLISEEFRNAFTKQTLKPSCLERNIPWLRPIAIRFAMGIAWRLWLRGKVRDKIEEQINQAVHDVDNRPWY